MTRLGQLLIPPNQHPPLGTSRLAWGWEWCASLLRSWALSFWREVSLCLRAASRLWILSTCCSARVVWHTYTYTGGTEIHSATKDSNIRKILLLCLVVCLPSCLGLAGRCSSPNESSRKPGWLPLTSPLSPYSSEAETETQWIYGKYFTDLTFKWQYHLGLTVTTVATTSACNYVFHDPYTCCSTCCCSNVSAFPVSQSHNITDYNVLMKITSKLLW